MPRCVAASTSPDHARTMSDVAISQPRPPATRKADKPKVTGKASQLIDLMIEEGLTYQEAAKRINMHVRHARKAMDNPLVLNELRRRKQVFRAGISAANILRLAEIRDQQSNQMASLGAIKILEQIDEDNQSVAGRSSSPGVTIVIGAPASVTAQQHRNEPNPLIIQGSRSSPAPDDGE